VITRFDHVVLAVRDLASASGAFAALGFDVRPGGRHTGRGTHNALVRFGLDYLELLATHDPAEAASTGTRGSIMTDYLKDREGGLLGFALASNDLDEEAARNGVPALGYSPGEPFAMQRARPDGNVLSWRLLVPGGHTWRRPWPFLIQWDNPDPQRLAWDGVGEHPNGAVGVAGLTILTRDLDAVARLYAEQLGMSVSPPDAPAELAGARRVRASLGECAIDLVQPGSSGWAAETLASDGEGVAQLRLRVRDLAATRDWLAQHGFETQSAWPESLRVSPRHAAGAELGFVQ
jgi:hypothetical protein